MSPCGRLRFYYLAVVGCGSKQLADDLAAAALPLVTIVREQYLSANTDQRHLRDDLLGVGQVALLEAVYSIARRISKGDAKPIKTSIRSYLSTCIRNALTKHCTPDDAEAADDRGDASTHWNPVTCLNSWLASKHATSAQVNSRILMLSDEEQRVFLARLENEDWKSIADKIGKSVRQAQRVFREAGIQVEGGLSAEILLRCMKAKDAAASIQDSSPLIAIDGAHTPLLKPRLPTLKAGTGLRAFVRK